MTEFKKNYRPNNVDYLKFGFFPSLSDKRLPFALYTTKFLNNDYETGNDLKYFQTVEEKLPKSPTVKRTYGNVMILVSLCYNYMHKGNKNSGPFLSQNFSKTTQEDSYLH